MHWKLLQGHCEFFWASFVTLCVEAPFILRHPNCLSLALFLWCKLLDRIRQRRPNEWKIDDLLCPPPPDFLITHKKSWQKKNLESNVSSPKSRQEQKSYNYPPQSPLVTFARLFSDQKKGSLSRKWWWNDQGFKRSAWYRRKMRGRANEAATVLLKIKLQKIGHSRHCREPFLALGYNVWKWPKRTHFLKWTTRLHLLTFRTNDQL